MRRSSALLPTDNDIWQNSYDMWLQVRSLAEASVLLFSTSMDMENVNECDARQHAVTVKTSHRWHIFVSVILLLDANAMRHGSGCHNATADLLLFNVFHIMFTRQNLVAFGCIKCSQKRYSVLHENGGCERWIDIFSECHSNAGDIQYECGRCGIPEATKCSVLTYINSQHICIRKITENSFEYCASLPGQIEIDHPFYSNAWWSFGDGIDWRKINSPKIDAPELNWKFFKLEHRTLSVW